MQSNEIIDNNPPLTQPAENNNPPPTVQPVIITNSLSSVQPLINNNPLSTVSTPMSFKNDPLTNLPKISTPNDPL